MSGPRGAKTTKEKEPELVKRRQKEQLRPPTLSTPQNEILKLQQTAGNEPTSRLLQKHAIQEKWTEAVSETGPVWDFVLTINLAPIEHSEKLQIFIEWCQDGMRDAARALGENVQVRTRTIRATVHYRNVIDYDLPREEALNSAYKSVTGKAVSHQSSESIPELPTVDPHLISQANNIMWSWTTMVVKADRNGEAGVAFEVERIGDQLVPGPARVIEQEPHFERASGMTFVSPATVFSELMDVFQWIIVGQSPRRFRIEFIRTDKGLMRLSCFRQIEAQASPRSKTEYEELGIPTHREMWESSKERVGAKLNELKIKALESGGEIAIELFLMWISDGTFELVFRHLGRGFRLLKRLVKEKNAEEIARAVQRLSKEEQLEFRALMKEIQAGEGKTLTAAQQGRLDQLAPKIEQSLEHRPISKPQISNVPPGGRPHFASGGEFEKWAKTNIFGGEQRRIYVNIENNQHLKKFDDRGVGILKGQRSSDFYVKNDDSMWDAKCYGENSRIDFDQLQDYRVMERAGHIFDPNNKKIKIGSVNYLFVSREAALKNIDTMRGEATAYYVNWLPDGTWELKVPE